MSGVAITRYLLANNANLVAAVAAANIKAGTIPLNSVLPALGINEATGEAHNNIPMNSDKVLITERVRVRVNAKDSATASGYKTQKTILELVRKALPNTHGTVNGHEVDSILPDTTGPDEYDADAAIYSQTRDFIVKFAVTR